MKWVEEKNIDSKAVKHLSSELKINTLLSKMLVRRNIKTYDCLLYTSDAADE